MDRRLILCLLFVALTNKEVFGCTNDEIQNCMRGISELVTNAGSSITTEGYIYSLTNDQVKEFCSIYNSEARPCLDNIKNSCSANVGALIEGAEAANQFMCGEGLEGLLKHKDCMGQDETLTPMLECQTKFKQEAPYITDTDTLCRKADESVECTQKAVRNHCGNDAAAWLKKYEKLVLKPILDKAGCHDVADLPLQEDYNDDNDREFQSDLDEDEDTPSELEFDEGRTKIIYSIIGVIGGIILLAVIFFPCIYKCAQGKAGQELNLKNKRPALKDPFASDIKAQGGVYQI